VLAYLKHPELITLQTNYITVINELGYMKSSYERQKKLYDENVGSGKDLQESESKYMAKKGEFKGLEYKLKMLGLKPESIANGNIEELIPVRAPIDGYIQNVRVKTSQFVQPEREMFEIINIEHVHADLMVFEKDVHLVKKGQKIIFRTEAAEGNELTAVIYSVGKSFEDQPKAVHIHADIQNKKGLLLPGMYISGVIMVSEEKTLVLPSEAVVTEGENQYVFQSLGTNNNEWNFRAVEVRTGLKYDGYTEVIVPKQYANAKFANDKGYYLLSEWKKDQSGHSHTH
jgi:cobalt-zinc-cadmium efflux system membrane fusion protein